jgi:SsrA-binding protein
MAKGKRKTASGDVASNRRAAFKYNLLDRFECGIVLTGTEVKSLREGLAQMTDSYATVRDGEVWLIGLYIAPYPAAARDNHMPERDRKLLLHRSEIARLEASTREKGLTVVPDLFQRRLAVAGEGRDRDRPRQGSVRQARDDQGPGYGT